MKNVLTVVAAVIVFIATFVMFLSSTSHASTPHSTSPKKGNQVSLVNGVEKWCDGPNLIYQAGAGSNGVSLQLSVNDPQCQ